jgi:hypothetical protein
MKLMIYTALTALISACSIFDSTKITIKNGKYAIDSLTLDINQYKIRFYDIKPNTIREGFFTENLSAKHDVFIRAEAYRNGLLFGSIEDFNDLGYIPKQFTIEISDSLNFLF